MQYQSSWTIKENRFNICPRKSRTGNMIKPFSFAVATVLLPQALAVCSGNENEIAIGLGQNSPLQTVRSFELIHFQLGVTPSATLWSFDCEVLDFKIDDSDLCGTYPEEGSTVICEAGS